VQTFAETDACGNSSNLKRRFGFNGVKATRRRRSMVKFVSAIIWFLRFVNDSGKPMCLRVCILGNLTHRARLRLTERSYVDLSASDGGVARRREGAALIDLLTTRTWLNTVRVA
jgi:hypothetical protein